MWCLKDNCFLINALPAFLLLNKLDYINCDPKVDKMSLDCHGARKKITSSNIYQATIIGLKDYVKVVNKRCIRS